MCGRRRSKPFAESELRRVTAYARMNILYVYIIQALMRMQEEKEEEEAELARYGGKMNAVVPI